MLNFEKKSDMLAIGTLINFIICNFFILFLLKWFILWLVLFIVIEVLLIGKDYIKPTIIKIRERVYSVNNQDNPSDKITPSINYTNDTVATSLSPFIDNVNNIYDKFESVFVTSINNLHTEPLIMPSTSVPHPVLTPELIAPQSMVYATTPSVETNIKHNNNESLNNDSQFSTAITDQPQTTNLNQAIIARPYIASPPRSLIEVSTPIIKSKLEAENKFDIAIKPEFFNQLTPRPLIAIKAKTDNLITPATLDDNNHADNVAPNLSTTAINANDKTINDAGTESQLLINNEESQSLMPSVKIAIESKDQTVKLISETSLKPEFFNQLTPRPLIAIKEKADNLITPATLDDNNHANNAIPILATSKINDNNDNNEEITTDVTQIATNHSTLTHENESKTDLLPETKKIVYSRNRKDVKRRGIRLKSISNISVTQIEKT